MDPITVNPYVVAGIVAALAVIIWKIWDQRQDARQKTYQKIGDAFAIFGEDQIAEAFKALARDGYEEFISILVNLAERLQRPNGVAEVLGTVVVKALRDPDFRDNPVVKQMLDPVLAEMALGLVFTEKLRQELTQTSATLAEYGSVEFSHLMAHLGANDLKAAEQDFHQIVALLRNPDRLDDEFMARAVKLLPAIVKADPSHLAKLKLIIDQIPTATLTLTPAA